MLLVTTAPANWDLPSTVELTALGFYLERPLRLVNACDGPQQQLDYKNYPLGSTTWTYTAFKRIQKLLWFQDGYRALDWHLDEMIHCEHCGILEQPMVGNSCVVCARHMLPREQIHPPLYTAVYASDLKQVLVFRWDAQRCGYDRYN